MSDLPLPVPGTARFIGIRTFGRLPHRRDLTAVDAAVVGVPFDTASSFRVGARFGPSAAREASQLLRPFSVPLDTVVLGDRVIDYGDIAVTPGETGRSFTAIGEALAPLHAAGVTPIIVGGDHSVLLPELRAAAAKHGPISVVHLDAHPDASDTHMGLRYTHGTPIKRAADEGLIDVATSIQVGMRGPAHDVGTWHLGATLGIEVLSTDDVLHAGPAGVAERIRHRVGTNPTYVSFDIDLVDPAFAPGTGTPEVGGLDSSTAIRLLRGLAGINIVGADVVEFYPQYDPAGITGFLVANLAFEMLALDAVNRAASPS